jgi:hypothetical protein
MGIVRPPDHASREGCTSFFQGVGGQGSYFFLDLPPRFSDFDFVFDLPPTFLLMASSMLSPAADHRASLAPQYAQVNEVNVAARTDPTAWCT